MECVKKNIDVKYSLCYDKGSHHGLGMWTYSIPPSPLPGYVVTI